MSMSISNGSLVCIVIDTTTYNQSFDISMDYACEANIKLSTMYLCLTEALGWLNNNTLLCGSIIYNEHVKRHNSKSVQ